MVKTNIFNEKLDIQVQKAGINYAELSKKSGVAVATLSLFLNGRISHVSTRTLSRISRSLGCKPEDIMC